MFLFDRKLKFLVQIYFYVSSINFVVLGFTRDIGRSITGGRRPRGEGPDVSPGEWDRVTGRDEG